MSDVHHSTQQRDSFMVHSVVRARRLSGGRLHRLHTFAYSTVLQLTKLASSFISSSGLLLYAVFSSVPNDDVIVIKHHFRSPSSSTSSLVRCYKSHKQFEKTDSSSCRLPSSSSDLLPVRTQSIIHRQSIHPNLPQSCIHYV